MHIGEIVSFLSKQLKGKRLKHTSRTCFEVLTLAGRYVGLPEVGNFLDMTKD